MDNKFLSLNIIVSKDEDVELARCLESCRGPLFDEICITIASDEMGEKVKKVAEYYTDNVTFFNWCNDFSAARNYNFSKSNCKYILWLDADDVIKPDSYAKLLQLKSTLNNYDMILIQYIYAHDEHDKPVVVLPRERIVKNCEEIKWHDPIHEYLNMDINFKIKKEENIFIDHYRTKPFNPQRNLVLLKQEYDKPGCSSRIKFYYGKELSDNGDWGAAVPVLEDCINTGDGFRDNLVVASIKLSRYYYSKKNYDAAKAIALKGISFNNMFAENYVLLGDVSWEQKDKENAIKYYSEALTKRLGSAGMSQMADYYKFIPAWRLSEIYKDLCDYTKALKYCDMALEDKPDYAELKNLRSDIIKSASMVKADLVLKDDAKTAFEQLASKFSLRMEVESNNIEYSSVKFHKTLKLKVAWLVYSLNNNDPSLRIRRMNVSGHFKKIGIDSLFIDNYRGKSVYDLRNKVEDASVIIFTMFGLEEFELMKYFKTLGKKIVFDFNEALFGYPLQHECFRESDALVCCSTALAEMAAKNGYDPIAVIKDAIEDYPDKPSAVYENRYDKPKALYLGMGGNSFLVTEYLKDTISKAGYELVVITEWDNATKKWDLNTWPKDMCDCDVVLCPQRVDVQPAKSNVKVTSAMDLGMPVLASPLQSYKEIIKSGENGFICDKQEDWYDALIKLKEPEFRKRIGQAGKASVSDYSLDSISNTWRMLLETLVYGEVKKKKEVASMEAVSQDKAREQVDLIIVNYNNVEYLKLCVSSVMMNTLYPFHLIISDAGSDEETWDYLKTLKGVTILGKQGVRKNFSEVCNAGICHSHSKYFVIMNSDLIVSKCWLTPLVDKMDNVNRLAACGVLSNCDRGWLHGAPGKPVYPMKLTKANIELVPGMKYDQIKTNVDELYSFMQESNKSLSGKYLKQDWVAAYCTIFARSALEEVGYFDTQYINGCEDLDLCRRLSIYGYEIGQAIDSFVFHFGGVSRGAYQLENKEHYDIEDKKNHILFARKWDKKKIAIWTGPAWEAWNKTQVDKGMAGSETWASYLAEAFAKKNYEVTVYNDLLGDKQGFVLEPVPGINNPVIYRDHTKFNEDMQYQYTDYLISSRSLEPIKTNVHTHRRYVMIHDIWLSQDPNFDILSWKVDKYGYLSEWHKQFLMQHHKMQADKMFLTANGENFDNYSDVDSFTKKNQAVYSSSPDRGLYELLQILPRIRAEVPDFELIVAYGFYNWESACAARKDVKGLENIAKIKKAMEQPGVRYVDRLDKKALAQYQKESKVWLYPTWFSETFSITALTAGLAKTAIVSSNYAGLTTTVGNAGILIDGNSTSAEYLNNFTEETIKLLKDEDYRKAWVDKAWKKMQAYSWDKIADGWIEQFNIVK